VASALRKPLRRNGIYNSEVLSELASDPLIGSVENLIHFSGEFSFIDKAESIKLRQKELVRKSDVDVPSSSACPFCHHYELQ
jgi:hypothetical protein